MSTCNCARMSTATSGKMQCGTCYGDIVDPDTARLTAELVEARGENAALTKDRDDWKRQHELYVNAWFRALQHRVIPKRHQIDALALTTQTIREKADCWDNHRRATAEQRTPGALEYASWDAARALAPKP